MTEATAAVGANSRLSLFDCRSRRAAQVLTDTLRLDGAFDLAQIREVAGDTRTYEDDIGLSPPASPAYPCFFFCWLLLCHFSWPVQCW